MAKRIFITGIGIISAIGKDASEALESIKKAHSGVEKIQHLKTIHKGKIPLCEVKYSNAELAQMAYEGTTTKASRTTLLGVIAAKEAWRSAGSPSLGDGENGCFLG